MAICKVCNGSRTRVLFQYPSPCDNCGGTGKVEDPKLPEDCLVFEKSQGFSSSEKFEFVLYSPAPALTIGNGGAEPWVQAQNSPADPNNDGYVRLRGDRRQIITAFAEGWVKALNLDDKNALLPECFVSSMVAVAPVDGYHLSQLLSQLEIKDLEPQAFVVSCVDFADIRVLEGQQTHREGTRIWVHGIEVLRSRELPAGSLVAVGETSTYKYKGALALLAR